MTHFYHINKLDKDAHQSQTRKGSQSTLSGHKSSCIANKKISWKRSGNVKKNR